MLGQHSRISDQERVESDVSHASSGGSVTLEKAAQLIQWGCVLEVCELTGIHKNAVLSTYFEPDVRLSPVRGFFHLLGTMRTVNRVVLVVASALARTAAVQSVGPGQTFQMVGFVTIKPQALAPRAPIYSNALMGYRFHTVMAFWATQAVNIRAEFHDRWLRDVFATL